MISSVFLLIPRQTPLHNESLLHPPVNSLTKLDPQRFRRLSLRAFVRGLPVVGHFVAVEEERHELDHPAILVQSIAGRCWSVVSFEATQRRVAQLEGALRAFATGPSVTILQKSQVGETCCTGSPCRRAAHSVQAVHHEGRETVGSARQGASLVEAVGGQQHQKLRDEVTQSLAPIQAPPDWEAQVASLQPMVRSAVGAGRSCGADPCREFGRFAAGNSRQTTSDRGSAQDRTPA